MTLSKNRKRIAAVILFYFLIINQNFSQGELGIHLESIDSTFYPCTAYGSLDTFQNANRLLVDYVIENVLINESDKTFISNRNLLKKLKYSKCDSTQIEIYDTLETGETCRIFLRTGVFNSSKRKVIIHKKKNSNKIIDGQIPYGRKYGEISFEIKELTILINENKIEIPHESYSNLYEPNICIDSRFHRKVEAYTSLNHKYIYLYIYGGFGADTYFSKLIFDKNKYMTKIIIDYDPLSIFCSFRYNFIGF